jgi:hypothetical protein
MKQAVVAVKLMTKFIKKITEHVEDSSVPKEIPPFARTLFVKQDSRKIILAATTEQKTELKQPAVTIKGGKCKSDGANPAPKRKKRETSHKFLAKRIFHVNKKGLLLPKPSPIKSKLKDGTSIFLDFCCHERKCKYPHQLCTNKKHFTTWKKVPDKDKIVLLSHMNDTGLLWFDKETMKKHKINFAPKNSHLLGNTMGPKPKLSKST